MTIKIETEKVIESDGLKKRKILKIEGALGRNELPKEYLESSDRVYFKKLSTGKGAILNPKAYDLEETNTIEEEKFQKSIDEIKKAGTCLHKINKKIKELKETWKGEETFLI